MQRDFTVTALTKNIIYRLLKFAGYIHCHKILPGNIFGRILKNKMATTGVSLSVVKSASISLIIGPRGLQCETILMKIMVWESSDVVRFDLGPLLQGQTRIATLKSAYNSLIVGPRGFNVKPTYRKSWAGNLLMWSGLTLGLFSRSNEDSQT